MSFLTSLNPLVATSPLRSGRVQGTILAAIGLATALGRLVGVDIPIEIEEIGKKATVDLIDQIALVLMGIGTLRAQSSKRTF